MMKIPHPFMNKAQILFFCNLSSLNADLPVTKCVNRFYMITVMINLNVLFKKKRKEYLHFLGVALFIKSWCDNLKYVYFCVNTFRFGWTVNDMLWDKDHADLVVCECVGLSLNPFSIGNSCLMIYHMWLHFQVWFRMAWNSIYFEKTIPFVLCMKYDFCSLFFFPSFIRRFEQEAWPELRLATSCWAIKLLDLVTH